LILLKSYCPIRRHAKKGGAPPDESESAEEPFIDYFLVLKLSQVFIITNYRIFFDLRIVTSFHKNHVGMVYRFCTFPNGVPSIPVEDSIEDREMKGEVSMTIWEDCSALYPADVHP
jgi:hypothetical protein